MLIIYYCNHFSFSLCLYKYYSVIEREKRIDLFITSRLCKWLNVENISCFHSSSVLTSVPFLGDNTAQMYCQPFRGPYCLHLHDKVTIQRPIPVLSTVHCPVIFKYMFVTVSEKPSSSVCISRQCIWTYIVQNYYVML